MTPSPFRKGQIRIFKNKNHVFFFVNFVFSPVSVSFGVPFSSCNSTAATTAVVAVVLVPLPHLLLLLPFLPTLFFNSFTRNCSSNDNKSCVRRLGLVVRRSASTRNDAGSTPRFGSPFSSKNCDLWTLSRDFALHN